MLIPMGGRSSSSKILSATPKQRQRKNFSPRQEDTVLFKFFILWQILSFIQNVNGKIWACEIKKKRKKKNVTELLSFVQRRQLSLTDSKEKASFIYFILFFLTLLGIIHNFSYFTLFNVYFQPLAINGCVQETSHPGNIHIHILYIFNNGTKETFFWNFL